ncbi:MAG: 30S ribosomal protein S16 [Candidatus Hydrothermota bacterium]|nr:30S ribosomal protein S16 [Candidatus Hydrothermae bacterium]RKY97037.1 MAG: 30S ribosomal protein S16 [Candidatus Hydrothermae bacterium]
MVKIRLQRVGKRNRPYYRIVVTDSRNPRGGKVIEIVGHYDPLKDGVMDIKLEQLDKWLSLGAQMTPRVQKLVNLYKKQVSKEVKS